MKYISSPQNPLLKKLRWLKSSTKARRESGQTLLEGVHLAESYLGGGAVPRLCVASEHSMGNQEVAAIVAACEARGVDCLSVDERQFRSISSVENGIGIALVIDIPASKPALPVLQNALLLDNIQDPGNLGAMLRTAAAAGVHQVYCSAGSAAVWSPKVLRAGMGAHFVLAVHEGCDLAEVVRTAKIPVYATTLEAGTTIYETDLTGPCAWLMGNEGQGVSGELLGLNVEQLHIPQEVGVESLNVAAAAAVCLFEKRRQQLARLQKKV